MNTLSRSFGLLSKKKLVARASPSWTLISTGAAGVALTLGLLKPVVYAETDSTKRTAKLKIYDEPKPEVIVVESPTRLEEAIRQTRLRVASTVRDVKSQFQQVTDRWIEFEQGTERKIKDVISPDERLMPEILYVAVAGLAGTVVATNRNIILRIASPVAFTVAASYYLLPKTTANIASKIYELEQQSPELVRAHNSITNTAYESKQKIDDAVKDLKDLFGDTVEKTKQGVKSFWK